jgi:general secretion pathway protein K
MSPARGAAPAGRAQRQRPRRAPHSQRGIALLVAILLVALGTMIAGTIAFENAMTARRGSATYAFDESILIAQGAEALAAYGLRQIYQGDQQNHTFYIGQGWDKPIGPLEVVPGVMLTASLEDLQGRFNVNNLVNADGSVDQGNLTTFIALLERLGLEPKWASLLIDWIDSNSTPLPDGAEDTLYTGLTPPYRTANRYITSVSELLALPGFGYERYQTLAPYITALPRQGGNATQVNICTASAQLLDAYIGAGHQEFDPQELTRTRANSTACFPTVQFYQSIFDPNVWRGQGAATGMAARVTTTSTYFRLTSFVTIGPAEFNLYSLLYLEGAGGTTGPGTVRPIQRSFTPD